MRRKIEGLTPLYFLILFMVSPRRPRAIMDMINHIHRYSGVIY